LGDRKRQTWRIVLEGAATAGEEENAGIVEERSQIGNEQRFKTMLTSIYADNFRSLVNFELKLNELSLLMGPNGSGKTSVFEVIRRLQRFISGEFKVREAFPASTLTRWSNLREQQFSLTMRIDDPDLHDPFLIYTLVIEHDEELRLCRVKREALTDTGKPLFEFDNGEVHLYRDDHTVGPAYPYDWTQSGMAPIQPRSDNKLLTAFKERLRGLVIASIVPSLMDAESQDEEMSLSSKMENFVSWYRRLSQENMGGMVKLFGVLKEVLPNFESFSFTEVGRGSKVLRVMFENNQRGAKPLSFDFDELSDGQRVLIALYTIVFALKGEHLSLFLDEPDNFVSLQEIQPWLAAVQDACGDTIRQAVIISHHPEIIDYLGTSEGKWFSREGVGPTRVSNEPPIPIEGLKLSETIVLGQIGE